MANTIPYPIFNWKATDRIRAWDLFQAKAELWLAGEEIKEEIQYTKIVLMLGDEGLSRWLKFDMGEDERKNPKDVFANVFYDSCVVFDTVKCSGEVHTMLSIYYCLIEPKCYNKSLSHYYNI